MDTRGRESQLYLVLPQQHTGPVYAENRPGAKTPGGSPRIRERCQSVLPVRIAALTSAIALVT